MISFINSAVIPLLLASAIPLLIYLFNRRKVKTIPFSSLRFLKMLESRRIRHVRLYQILLILIRMLFILFLVLAFSRPAIRTIFPGGSHSARTTAVLILDDSYSMHAVQGNESAFERAQKYLEEIVSTFSEEDQVYIISATDGLWESRTKISPYKLKTKFSVKNSSPHFCPAFQKAAKIFARYPNLNKELYFISDFRIPQTLFCKVLPKELVTDDIKIFLAKTGSPEEMQNTAIDSAYVVEQFYEINKALTVKALLHNCSRHTSISTTVHLFSDNRRLASRNIEIPGGETEEALLSFVPEKGGYRLLHLEIEDDDLLADNRYFLTLHLQRQIKVLAVNIRLYPAMETALQTLSEYGALQVEYSTFASWQGKNFLDYDIILMNDWPAMNEKLIERLLKFRENNKSIIIIPGERIAAGASLPEDLSGGVKLFGKTLQAQEAGAYFAPDEKFLQKSLFHTVLKNPSHAPLLPEIYKYYKLSGSVKALIALQNGDPFLGRLSGARNSKGIYVFASEMKQSWTNLTLSGIFLPLLQRLISAAARTEIEQRPFTVGETARLFLPNLAQQQTYILKTPSADSYPLIPRKSSAGLFFNLRSLDEPGHYTLMENGKIKHVFPVNLCSSELKRPYFDSRKIFPKGQMLSLPDEIKEQILKNRKGIELWRIFLLLALLMLLSEMLLIRLLEGKTLAGTNHGK